MQKVIQLHIHLITGIYGNQMDDIKKRYRLINILIYRHESPASCVLSNSQNPGQEAEMETDKAAAEGREFALLWLLGMASVPIVEEITLPH